MDVSDTNGMFQPTPLYYIIKRLKNIFINKQQCIVVQLYWYEHLSIGYSAELVTHTVTVHLFCVIHDHQISITLLSTI